MGRVHVVVGRRLLLDDQLHIVRDIHADGTAHLENLSFGGSRLLNSDDIASCWAEGRLRFEVGGPGTRLDTNSGLATAYTRADFDALPSGQREQAWERYRLLDTLFHWCQQPRWTLLTRSVIQTFLDTQDTTTVSANTVERWLKAFLESGGDLRALVPLTNQRGGKGQSRLHPDVEHVVQTVLASCQQQPTHRTSDQIYALMLYHIADANSYRQPDNQLTPPSRATLYRRLEQAGQTNILRRRAGRAQQHRESNVASGPRPTRLLERVEIDHTPLHLFVVDMDDRLPIGRPTLTLATDTYSKMPFGFDISFQPGSYLTVMRCLRHGILPKPDCQTLYGTTHAFPVYGLPETVVVDRGKEFVGNSLVNALGMLGVIHEVMPGRTPWYKGSIERFFRTQNQGLLEGLPGYTFGDIFSRADYDPVQDACISLEAFHNLLHIFLLDIYAQRWHEGIQDIPARRWQQSIQSGLVPTLYHDAEELRILLCASETRTLTRRGIAWETLQYNSSELAYLRQRTRGDVVRFRYDPDNLGEIYVFDPEIGWLTVPALHPDYAQGLSLYKHRVIRQMLLADKHDSVDIYALAEARLRLQDLVAQEFAQTRRQRGRKQQARLLKEDSTVAQLGLSSPNMSLLPPDLPLPDRTGDDGWRGDYNLPQSTQEPT
ncbi:MAG: Mu transposase C-terminal domain-containing protein [Aggregatilineales bacterium]